MTLTFIPKMPFKLTYMTKIRFISLSVRSESHTHRQSGGQCQKCYTWRWYRIWCVRFLSACQRVGVGTFSHLSRTWKLSLISPSTDVLSWVPMVYTKYWECAHFLCCYNWYMAPYMTSTSDTIESVFNFIYIFLRIFSECFRLNWWDRRGIGVMGGGFHRIAIHLYIAIPSYIIWNVAKISGRRYIQGCEQNLYVITSMKKRWLTPKAFPFTSYFFLTTQ